MASTFICMLFHWVQHQKMRLSTDIRLFWDRSVLTPGWFLTPKWSNSAFSSQWKLRVMLLKSPPCVSFGAWAVLIQEKEVAITWLYGAIQSWYITHGIEKISFLPVSDDQWFMNKTLKHTFCASQPWLLSCSSRLDLTAQYFSVLANYHV